MAEKVCLSRSQIEPGPKRGNIASREQVLLDLKEEICSFEGAAYFIFDFFRLKVTPGYAFNMLLVVVVAVVVSVVFLFFSYC